MAKGVLVGAFRTYKILPLAGQDAAAVHALNIEKDENGMYIAEVPDMKGCYTPAF